MTCAQYRDGRKNDNSPRACPTHVVRVARPTMKRLHIPTKPVAEKVAPDPASIHPKGDSAAEKKGEAQDKKQ